MKDLRDTFASQLLTAGVQLGYVSAQLGHADVSVTARHYARWIEGDHYREPRQLEPGEVPADLLARIGSDPTSDPRTRLGVVSETEAASQLPATPHETWSGKRDSNPRPSAWEADALPTELFPRAG